MNRRNRAGAGVPPDYTAHNQSLQRLFKSTDPIAKLLPRLERVRETGAGEWLASCTVHEDRSPSLSIRAVDDGRLLVNCFAGCRTHDVLSAIGLRMSDLFPPNRDHYPRLTNYQRRRHNQAFEALRAIRPELMIVAIAVADCINGKPLNETDLARLIEADLRIRAALEVAA